MQKPRGKASLRLALGLSALLIVFSLGAMALQYRATAAELDRRERSLLAADLAGLAALYDQRRIISLRQAMEFRSAAAPETGMLYLLEGKDGEKLAGNIDALPEGLTPAPGGIDATDPVAFTLTGTPYLGVARELRGGFPMLVARSRAPTEAALAATRAQIFATALVLVALSLVAGWLASRFVMRRIDRLNRLADQVAAGDLSARLPGPRADDEFGALERHIHTMLDRIGHLTRAHGRLSDTIAHELRTPLNRIQGKLDKLEGDPEAIAAVSSEIRGTVRIFDSLLEISSAEAASGGGTGLVPVSLSQITREVSELYEPLAEEKSLEYGAVIEAGCKVLGDRNLIAQLLSNLVDNAIKFCRAGDAITISLEEGPERHILSISDTGPGVPAAEREAVFERFARAERDREVAGHGLGLALVRAIATRHGAKLRVLEAEKGFSLQITWPKLPAEMG
ncbi:sensor histidine kinase [Vannielia litorea]|uniref:sensor histidine kinase n=1 Tax=Vannielia litorea TaxID=1217970 RepID=UPI001C981FD3|nr:HAMP domain-containing sensor histidine kinase [Vannielia litorea]MBY6046254.1 HAMP domain-containing histidine kinase [Vannielia litorea]MBY6073667.1 HAMP domain-containing histidine kinase [Vannielia litorea]